MQTYTLAVDLPAALNVVSARRNLAWDREHDLLVRKVDNFPPLMADRTDYAMIGLSPEETRQVGKVSTKTVFAYAIGKRDRKITREKRLGVGVMLYPTAEDFAESMRVEYKAGLVGDAVSYLQAMHYVSAPSPDRITTKGQHAVSRMRAGLEKRNVTRQMVLLGPVVPFEELALVLEKV